MYYLRKKYFEYPDISQKRIHNLNYNCFDVSSQGNLIIGTEFGEFLQFNGNNLKFINKFYSPKQKRTLKSEKSISCLVFNSIGNMFLSGGCDKSIKIWICY